MFSKFTYVVMCQNLISFYCWTISHCMYVLHFVCTFILLIQTIKFIYTFFLIFLNIYLFLRDRETQSASGGGPERKEDTDSEAGSRLWAVNTEPDVGLEPTNCEIMTWAEVECSTNWATKVPQHGWTLKTMPSERIQSQRVTYHLSQWIWNVHDRQIYTDSLVSGSCLWLKVGKEMGSNC